MLLEAVVGERRAGAGVQTDGRSGPYGDLIVNDVGLGKYFEATRLGRIFSAATAVGATLNAAASPLAAAGTAVWGLYNPSGNTKAAAILKASCMMRPGASATPVFPVWEYRTNLTGLTAAGVSTVAVNGVIGVGTVSTMKMYIAAALTGAAAASTFLRNWEGSFDDPRHAGAASETGVGCVVEETDGRIIVPPGCFLNVAFDAAGAAVTGCVAVTWAEVDWPL